MPKLELAFSVLTRAMDRLARMGVADVHARLSTMIVPEGHADAEVRAFELAQQAIAELHIRGLEAVAAELSLELGVPPSAPARLAGSTVIEEAPPAGRTLEISLEEGVTAEISTQLDEAAVAREEQRRGGEGLGAPVAL